MQINPHIKTTKLEGSPPNQIWFHVILIKPQSFTLRVERCAGSFGLWPVIDVSFFILRTVDTPKSDNPYLEALCYHYYDA